MKKLLVILSLVMSLTAMASISEQWIRANYSKTEHRIPMRDGVRLHTIVYAPNDSLSHPILLTRCTYGAGPYEPDSYDQALWKLLEPFTSRGYIIVKQDLRGLRMSEGTFMHIRPVANTDNNETNELTDTYDTAEWLLANTSNNGRIGVSGHSYLGFTSLLAGMSGHPAIKAVSPQAPIGAGSYTH
ncbi:MAG: CocE/NonD family hydrolase, partial [Muribaculaceae bacterium]|nr:CocE/NonD family hydrolase [Muribaculaceae bacterium]